MYDWVTHTWNAIKGKCSHDCSYCYMKMWGELKPLRFDGKEMNRDLGNGNFIFVGSSTDMWAKDVPDTWISSVLSHCEKHDNRYLFQSKNPDRFCAFSNIPENTVFCTTIESNRDYPKISNAPKISKRIDAMLMLYALGYDDISITIEPILDFDLLEMIEIIKKVKPTWVNIGADSKNHGLPEPEYSKVFDLINALKEFTEIRKKSNLNRLKRVS